MPRGAILLRSILVESPVNQTENKDKSCKYVVWNIIVRVPFGNVCAMSFLTYELRFIVLLWQFGSKILQIS